MHKYTNSSKVALADILNSHHSTSANQPYSHLDPKNLPLRSQNYNFPKQFNNDSNEPIFTSKTARPTQDTYSKNNTSYSRNANITRDEEIHKKENTFRTTISGKMFNGLEKSFQKEQKEGNTEQKTWRGERSQKAMKTIMIQNISNKEEDKSQKSFLRQTVSNATFWNSKKISPIKISDLKKEINKTYQEASFRKKIDSESMPTDDYIKQFKHKIYSNHHSRQNSSAYIEPENKSIDIKTIKNKTPPFGLSTQRVSQDKPIIKKDKMMSQTDPDGGYFQRTASKKPSYFKPKEPSDLTIDDFKLGSCIGEGRFGKVFPAVHKKTGWLVGIKQIKKEEVRLMLDQFVQQIKINLFANHCNVVKMYGFFHDHTYFYIMMEYMEEGSLYKVIKTNKKLKEEQARSKLYDICDAVRYLHSQDILHRDIKPQNIVLSNGVCKLCDFGWATYSKDRRTTYCGTLDYVCPEILEGQSYDNFVDIWAIGVLAYEMLTGKAPFYHISRKETMKSIMNCDFSFPAEMSLNAKMFIKKALQKNPDQRFTVESLLQDRFLSQLNPRG